MWVFHQCTMAGMQLVCHQSGQVGVLWVSHQCTMAGMQWGSHQCIQVGTHMG